MAIVLMIMSTSMIAQTRVTSTASATIVSIEDTASIAAIFKNVTPTKVKPNIDIQSGMTARRLAKEFERPLSIVKMDNSKEKWVYDTTVVYINKGIVDFVRKVKK